MGQDSKGKFPASVVNQSCEEYRVLRMGKGGRRPPKLENPVCDKYFNLTHFYRKSRELSKKD